MKRENGTHLSYSDYSYEKIIHLKHLKHKWRWIGKRGRYSYPKSANNRYWILKKIDNVIEIDTVIEMQILGLSGQSPAALTGESWVLEGQRYR